MINRPRHELFAFWRDFTNLPTFMHAIESIQMIGDNRSAWTVKAPAGQHVTIETEVRRIRERNHRLAVGRGVADRTEGRVSFADAPGERGTVVSAVIAYKPPAGELGRLVAKLFLREPEDPGAPRSEAIQDADGNRRDRHSGADHDTPMKENTDARPDLARHQGRPRRHRCRIPRSSIPRDAIIKVTSTAICGSDLHLYDGVIPA